MPLVYLIEMLSSSFCTGKREVEIVRLFRDLISGRRLLQSLLFLGSRAGLTATGHGVPD